MVESETSRAGQASAGPRTSRISIYAQFTCWGQWAIFVINIFAFTPLCGSAPRGFGVCLIPNLIILIVLYQRKRRGRARPSDHKDLRMVIIHMVVFAVLMAAMGVLSVLPSD
jgi:hypothetical protein